VWAPAVLAGPGAAGRTSRSVIAPRRIGVNDDNHMPPQSYRTPNPFIMVIGFLSDTILLRTHAAITVAGPVVTLVYVQEGHSI